MTDRSEPKAKSIRCNNCGHDNLSTATNCLVCDSPLSYTSRFQKEKHIPTGLLPPTEDELEQAKRAVEQERVESEERAYQDSLNEQQHQPESTGNSTTGSVHRTGIKCPDCGYVNRVGDMFCIECGASIMSVAPQVSSADTTQQIDELKLSKIHTRNEEPPASATIETQSPSINIAKPKLKSIDDMVIPDGCFQFASDMRLRFTDIDTGRYLEVKPSKDKPLLIGRSHESLPIQPEIDLTPFLMEQHGVSRRHALLRLRDLRLEIQDLNSTNGTGINGFRFQAKETHQIRSGDVVTLGRVSIKLTFLRKDAPQGNTITDLLGS